jgi:aminoglycoside phosphotransferase (APT) family kinase protein
VDGVGTWLARYPDSPVVLDVLGTGDADEIRALVRELVPETDEIFWFRASVGAVFGVRTSAGERIALKVHKRDNGPYLDAMQRVQAHLAERGFPCPRPLGRRGRATLEEWIDAGAYRDAHEPAVRRVLAELLARLHALTSGLDVLEPWRPEGERPLWPVPHNVLFDFAATARGAEWIDDIARAAKERRDAPAGRDVIGHGDWSVSHFRFDGLRPTVIYDWDSLTADRETLLVGLAAATFTYTEHLDVDLLTSVEESRAFVAEYETARGTSFDDAERRACAGSIVYAKAYGARCRHAVGARDPGKDLTAFADAFL